MPRSKETVTIDQPWTDWTGRRHEQMVGRPVAFHAMRGISAHANGFHTCRALHLLQVLLGAIDCPGGFRYKPPFPKPIPPGPKPTGRSEQVAPEARCRACRWAFPTGPEDLLVEPDGSPSRIDKAFSWDAPLAVHGMMHMVISNAWRGDPYPVDTLFMYMANMAWNSSMNSIDTAAMLTDRDPETGEYRIPRIIYSDAFNSEMVAYADLVLPDTTYLERWDCISLLDRPICEADGAADAIRQPVVAPDRDVRPFQDVLIDLGARIGLPGLTAEDGSPRYPGGYSDYIVNHERKPGIGPLAGWRGTDGSLVRPRRGQPGTARPLRRERLFLAAPSGAGGTVLQIRQPAYLERAVALGLIDHAQPIVMQLYSEALQKFRLAARGHGAVQPPETMRQRVETFFDPLPFWYRPFDTEAADAAGRSAAARGHPAAHGHVPFLGLAERLAAPDPRPATGSMCRAPWPRRPTSPTATGSG